MTVRFATILFVAAGLASPAFANDMSGSKLSSEQVKEVQQALQAKGSAQDLQSDGVWGPKTEQAIMEFQKSKNIQANGELDSKTVAALGLNSSDFQSGEVRSSGGASSSSSAGSATPSASEPASSSSSASPSSSAAPSSTAPSSNANPQP